MPSSPRRFPPPCATLGPAEYLPVLSAQRETLEALGNQAVALVDKLPEHYKFMDGFERVDPNSSEGKEFMSILSELDKSCVK